MLAKFKERAVIEFLSAKNITIYDWYSSVEEIKNLYQDYLQK